MTDAHLVSLLAGEAAAGAIRQVDAGEVTTLGAVEDVIQSAMTGWLNKHGPELANRLMVLAEPAAKKAAEVVGPVVEAKLKAYTPIFAAIVGGMFGLSLLLGARIGRGR